MVIGPALFYSSVENVGGLYVPSSIDSANSKPIQEMNIDVQYTGRSINGNSGLRTQKKIMLHHFVIHNFEILRRKVVSMMKWNSRSFILNHDKLYRSLCCTSAIYVAMVCWYSGTLCIKCESFEWVFTFTVNITMFMIFLIVKLTMLK